MTSQLRNQKGAPMMQTKCEDLCVFLQPTKYCKERIYNVRHWLLRSRKSSPSCGRLWEVDGHRVQTRIGTVAVNQKNAFEWGTSTIPHTADAVQVTQNAANFLVSEARKSSQVPAVNKVLDHLIYNYVPTYSGKAGKGYDEVYIFA